MEFIRFGELPDDGKSTIFKGNEPVGKEAGISVYEAHRNSKGPRITYPFVNVHDFQHILRLSQVGLEELADSIKPNML